jgi:hypothetical protein
MTVSILGVDISQGSSLMEFNVEGKEKIGWVDEGFLSYWELVGATLAQVG